jgi:DNA-binding response OmpR family regulator
MAGEMPPIRLLLVEDDDVARLALSRILEAAGYLVDTAPTGEDGLRYLEQSSYEAVISDMRLPDIDGIAVLQFAMRLPVQPAVILLTGHGTLETAIAAIRMGATDYLLKPCSPKALLAGVAGALEKRRAAHREAETIRSLAEGVAQIQRQLLAIGGTEVDPAAATYKPAADRLAVISVGTLQVGRFPNEVVYRSQPLRVTPIEHAMLRCLSEAGGDVVAYEEIVRRTHGFATSHSDAQMLLKSHVRNLRRKVGDDLIVNVRHVGYRLGPEAGGAPIPEDL